MAETDDALDELYAAAPGEFTALRTRLAAAAKKRGDAAEAKRITAARKPTMSAYVVNRLVHDEPEVAARISGVGERLRAAHAAMDGEQIRQLSTEQRKLVGELTRAAIRAAGVATPSAALRDDVTDTLQAAVADPEVTARLGRLTKAEQWSGFGEFGDTTAVVSPRTRAATTPAARKAPSPPSRSTARDDAAKAERERREQARAVLAAAEKARSEADKVTAQRQSDLATARLRHDDARERLAKAEQALRDAEAAFDEAKQAGREAADVVREARSTLSGKG